MRPTRTDDDLERLLRTTLDSHAATVVAGPAWTGSNGRPQQRRWVAPLLAAAVVAALTATLAVLYLYRSRPAPVLKPSGFDFTTFSVAGYEITDRTTMDGIRSVSVCSGSSSTGMCHRSVDLTTWAKGDYTFTPLQQQRRVMISGHRGYTGVNGTDQFNNRKPRPIRAVIWEYAPGTWAVMQSIGGVPLTPIAEMVRIARAAHPEQELTMPGAPFRVTYRPPGFTLYAVVTYERSRSLQVTLHGRHNSSLEIYEQYVHGAARPDVHSVRHGDIEVSVFTSGARAGAAPADNARAARVLRSLVWQPTALGQIVP
jgi:hypothetical protein